MQTHCSYFLELKMARERGKKSNPEVLFPNEFIQIHPWGDNPRPLETQCHVMVKQLMHVTHNAKAENIASVDDIFTFQAEKKFAKKYVYDGSPLGESYKSNPDHTSFTYIRPNETIFPGCYSWWSIFPAEDERRPISPYGNQAFVCDFPHMLTAYAKSRKTDICNVCLRKGGTLRYKYEICYVLIICQCDDGDIREFEPLELASNKFDSDGLIDKDGRILKATAVPTFHLDSFIDNMHHEEVAIAFYFPKTAIMNVESPPAYCQKIRHSRCIKTCPPPGEQGPFKCPNEW